MTLTPRSQHVNSPHVPSKTLKGSHECCNDTTAIAKPVKHAASCLWHASLVVFRLCLGVHAVGYGMGSLVVFSQAERREQRLRLSRSTDVGWLLGVRCLLARPAKELCLLFRPVGEGWLLGVRCVVGQACQRVQRSRLSPAAVPT